MPQVCFAPKPPDWDDIDTVLLDLDGTLLDLAFDNSVLARAHPRALCARRRP